MIPEEQAKYEKALEDFDQGLITKEQLMLAEAEFKEWSESKGQLLNG
jgi:hypothetical protein